MFSIPAETQDLCRKVENAPVWANSPFASKSESSGGSKIFGGANLRGGGGHRDMILLKFPPKLHEIKENWAQRVRPLHLP